MLEINVNVKATELVNAIERLLETLGGLKQEALNTTQTKITESDTPEKKLKDIEEIKPKKQEKSTYTLEEVRKAFGDLSKSKGKDVAKTLLSELGVSKVTELEELGLFDEAIELIKAVK